MIGAPSSPLQGAGGSASRRHVFVAGSYAAAAGSSRTLSIAQHCAMPPHFNGAVVDGAGSMEDGVAVQAVGEAEPAARVRGGWTRARRPHDDNRAARALNAASSRPRRAFAL